MALQLDALYITDVEGRLRYIRELDRSPAELPRAPRFCLSRSADQVVWRFREDIAEQLTARLDAVCRRIPAGSPRVDTTREALAIRSLLVKHAAISQELCGPAYWIPQQIPSSMTQSISPSNLHYLESNFPWAMSSELNHTSAPMVVAVVGQQAVAICHCARLTQLAAEAGVETARPYRGQGYAGLVVAHWAELIRGSGRLPLYSTAWENLGSRAVAAKLNLSYYAENWSIY